jgi:ABC-type multidrug transport system fused ATPase/permease subunit
LEAEAGSILIDNIDIQKIGVHDLRSKLTVIPQDPVLFSGTLRSNLDPFDEYQDEDLWNSLRVTHFLESTQVYHADAFTVTDGVIQDHHITLDSPVAEGGTNFSQGQRQLLCLARAILKRSRVIILDEATASIDHSTDSKIQQTIRDMFTNSSLLCIAHRLSTIMDYDKILVLDKGRVSQFGTPAELIHQEGIFQQMCRESNEFDKLVRIATTGQME